ncbi:MAG: undecaprenyl-phosphate glucose phosphotransferase [Pseudorhodoplanes sp.]
MGKFETTLHRQAPQRAEAAYADFSERGLPRLGAKTLAIASGAIECLLIATACYQSGALYHRLVFGQLPYATFYLAATFCLAVTFVAPSGFSREYSIKRLLDPKAEMRSVFARWNVAYALFVLALFMTHATDFYSRGSIAVQYGAGLASAILIRLSIARLATIALEKGILIGNRVLVIGEAPAINETVRQLRRDSRGAEIVATIDLDPLLARSSVDGIRFALEKAEAISRRYNIDDIVICLPWSKSEAIRDFVDGLASIPATIHTVPDPTWRFMSEPALAHVGGICTIRLARTPLTRKDQIIKRAFDLSVSSLLLILSAPFLLLIAALIKLDSRGPVIFRQRRNGFNQQEFRVFKFRTMTTLDDGPVIPQATRNDQRITSLGKILRATNIDELPQLLNVIRGDMSLVGPRPHAVAHNDIYEERIRLYARRHNVKPGITGWAQVHGFRGETDSIQKMRDRVEHDLHYIDHWSLVLDIKILFMTVFSLRSYRNAY